MRDVRYDLAADRTPSVLRCNVLAAAFAGDAVAARQEYGLHDIGVTNLAIKSLLQFLVLKFVDEIAHASQLCFVCVPKTRRNALPHLLTLLVQNVPPPPVQKKDK